MVKAVRYHRTGGPEVLSVDDVAVPAPGPGQALIRQSAIGVNYIDIYFRTGVYPVKDLPLVLGMEAAGVVEAVGPDTRHVQPGDRVTYCMTIGAYAERRVIDADRLVRIPEGMSEETAAAVTLRGLTAQYLLKTSYPVQRGDTIVVHAAAGGVGLLLCQWAKHLGATVIGTVGSDAKAALAKAHGCDHAIVYTREDWVKRVMEITGGAGVPVIYDSVGKDTFHQGFGCLRRLGHLVCFGQASGKIPPLEIGSLQPGGWWVTRAGLANHVTTRGELESRSADLFDAIRKGVLKVEINHRYPLAEAARAHADLEGRRTTGSTILVV